MLARASACVDVRVRLPQCCDDHLEIADVQAHGLDESLLVLADVAAVEPLTPRSVSGQLLPGFWENLHLCVYGEAS